jgi:two-component sensor histidine kinase
MCQMINNKQSYQETLSEMRIDNLIGEISSQAFNQRIISGKYVQPFRELNQEFIDHFLISDKREQIYAVDGSKINLGLSMTRYGFEKFKNRPYTTGLISIIYDVKHQVPLEYCLSSSLNERSLFYNQLIRLKTHGSNDIFIFDRGYYSFEMIDRLSNRFQNYIFRVKNNLKIIDSLVRSGRDELVFIKNQHPMRIVRYTINPKNDYQFIGQSDKIKLKLKTLNVKGKDQTYYLVTSLVDSDKYPLSKLKELYHRRWSIEEYYKKIKRNLISGTYHSRCHSGLETEFSIQQTVNLLIRYFSNHINQHKNYPINQKITGDLLINKILPMIVYNQHDSEFEERIKTIFNILAKNIIPIRNDRRFERIKIFPVSKHIYQENKYPKISDH